MYQVHKIVVLKVGRAIYTWTDPEGGENPKTSGTIASFKFKAKQKGTANFSVTGDFYSPDETSINPTFSGVSVAIQEVQTKPNDTNTENNSGNANGLGNNSNGQTGNVGGTSTPSSNNTNQGGSSGSGGNTGTNTNTSGGTTTISKNANLKELHLDIEGLSPSFNKNVTNYSIIIPENKDSISVNAIPENNNSKVEITGNTNLKNGLNKINIKVIAQDNKTTKNYVINATKTNNPDSANAKLENLAIENVTLEPEFNENTMQYNVSVGSNVETLNILAVPQIQEANFQIEGNEKLEFGENIITITVTAVDGVTKEQYIIKAYKKTVEEEENEIALLNAEMQQAMQEEAQQKSEPKLKIGNLIFAIFIAICVLGIIFVLIMKYKNERNNIESNN